MKRVISFFIVVGSLFSGPTLTCAQEADALAEIRLAHLDERREGGIALLSVGAASAIGGAITAGALNDNPFGLGFGLGTLVWGATNAALSFFLLDLDGGRRNRILSDAAAGDPVASRERAIADENGSVNVLAFNAALDLFYIASGVLLLALADRIEGPDERGLLRGYSLAQMSQGAFLLVFDVVEWLVHEANAQELREAE